MPQIAHLFHTLAALIRRTPTVSKPDTVTGAAEPIYIQQPQFRNPPTHRKPIMDKMYLLSLLIPAITEIAHDAITAFYKLHGDQTAQPWATATPEQKDATTAAVVNAVNGNPDPNTVAGNLVSAVVATAKSAIDLTVAAHQGATVVSDQMVNRPIVSEAQIAPGITLPAEPPASIPVGEVIEHHDAAPAPPSPIPETSIHWHPGIEPTMPESATQPEASK